MEAQRDARDDACPSRPDDERGRRSADEEVVGGGQGVRPRPRPDPAHGGHAVRRPRRAVPRQVQVSPGARSTPTGHEDLHERRAGRTGDRRLAARPARVRRVPPPDGLAAGSRPSLRAARPARPRGPRLSAPACRADTRPARRGGRRMSVATLVRDVSTVPAKPALPPGLDDESREWLRGLRAIGADRDAAVARLHELLLKAARFEVSRRRVAMPHLRGDDLDDIAHQAADDALVSVLRRLEDFRGASRFTTWAYKFALLEAAVKLRKRAWQGREIPLEDDAWGSFASLELDPAAEAEQSELLVALRQAVEEVLTPRQRQVLVALAVDGVPIDVLAERLDSTRGALYKTLHDARRKLRAHLEEAGLPPSSAPEETS